MENHNNNKDNRKLEESRFKENRILAGIVFLGILVAAGFFLTWAFPRDIAEKPSDEKNQNIANQDIADIITQRVTEIREVEGAQVIVLSRTALIALDLKQDIPVNEIKRIKDEVGARSKNIPQVDEVLVTANPDLGEEVKKILEGEAPLERLEYIYERIRDQKM